MLAYLLFSTFETVWQIKVFSESMVFCSFFFVKFLVTVIFSVTLKLQKKNKILPQCDLAYEILYTSHFYSNFSPSESFREIYAQILQKSLKYGYISQLNDKL